MSTLPLRWRYRSWAACIIIPLLVNAISFSTVVKRLGRKTTKHRAPIDDNNLARWVTEFLLRLPDAWYPTCLRRGAVLYYLLRRAGRPVHLCLGVQRADDGSIDAHAWLTLNELPYLEPSTTNPEQYKLIARFPEDALDPSNDRGKALNITEV